MPISIELELGGVHDLLVDLELVRDLRQKLGMAIIWITHDLGVVAGIADRVMVMYGGQVVEQAPVRELFANPQHPYTKALLDCVPDAEGKKMLKPIDYAWLADDQLQELADEAMHE